MLIYGFGTVPPPSGMKVLLVKTTKEMCDAVFSELKSTHYDVCIATAAAADFAPERAYERKVDSHITPQLELKLKTTPKIIDETKKISPDTFLVALKAEYKLSDNEPVETAYERLKTSNADLIVANDVGREGVGFQTDTNEVFILSRDKKVIHIPLTSKKDVARKLVNVILEKIHAKI